MKVYVHTIFLSASLFLSPGVLAQWEIVGDTYPSSPSTHHSIAINSEGVPHVAFRDGSVNGKTSVIKLEDGIWVNVGEAGFSESGFSGTDFHNIVFDENDIPYVAFRDLNNGTKPSVMMFNGSEWEYVGESGFTTGAVSYITLALDNSGVPHVGLREVPLADKCSVFSFDGDNWQYVGEPGFSSWDSQSAYLNLVIDPNNNIYLAYQEEVLDDAVSVSHFNGTEWEYTGEPGFSAGATSSVSMVGDEAGNLYVAYRDNFNGGKCSVKSYNGGSWEPVGAEAFTPDAVSYLSIQIDPLNRLIVGFKDWGNGGKTSVMRYADGGWAQMGNAGFSTIGANHQSLATNQYGHMYTAYGTVDLEVQRFVVSGCTNLFACNYNIDATDDDGSCVVLNVFEITGELNPQAGSIFTYTYPETAGSSYQWEVTNGTILSGQGSPSIEVEWGTLGEASITVVETNEQLCESPPVVLEITIPVGVEIWNEQDVLIYPNPASDRLVITNIQEKQTQLKLVNLSGQTVYEDTVSGGNRTIDLTKFPTGRYELTLSANQNTQVFSVIVRR